MELRHLRYFVVVAEESNVSRAAGRLHISQPALSRQIKDLEYELGTELFERTGNAVRLLASGKTFLAEARAVLRRVDEAVAKMALHKGHQLARVRLGYAASPAREIISRAMEILQARHPGHAVELQDLTSSGIVRGLREGKLDIALTVTMAPSHFDGFVLEEFTAHPVCVVMHRQHRLAKHRVVPVAEVAKENLVMFSKAEHPEAHTGLLGILGAYNDDLKISMECDSITSLLAAVEAKKGVSLVFPSVARLAGKNLVVKRLTPNPPLLPLGLVYRKGELAPATRALLTALREARPKPGSRRQRVIKV